MGTNDFQIGLVGKLDANQSKQQLNSDIDALKKQLLNKAANFYNVSPEQDIEQMQRERLQSFVS